MVVSLVLAVLALRAGLVMRRARQRGTRPPRGALARHLRLAKPAVAMLCVGFAGGPVSAVALRGWSAFGTAHSLVATTALALYVATAVLGRRLEQGRGRPVELHALLALVATLIAMATAATGFVLLP